jgi:hypothetical protein
MLVEQKNVLSMNGEHFSIENGHMFVQTYHFLTMISMNIIFIFICKHIFCVFLCPFEQALGWFFHVDDHSLQ